MAGQGISRRSVVIGAAAAAASAAATMPSATDSMADELLSPATAAAQVGARASPTASTSSGEAELVGLGMELERLKRRCWRQRGSVGRLLARAEDICRTRGIGPWRPDGRRNPDYDQLRDELGCTKAWMRWSEALAASLELVTRIERTPADGLVGLQVKFGALMWLLTYDDGLMDDEHERALRRFGNELRDLVGQGA